MSIRFKLLDKEYTIKESIKNVKKCFEMQKTFVKMGEAADGEDVEKAISANLEAIDGMVSFLLDIIPDKKLTTDKLNEDLSYTELGNKVQEVISKLLHVDEEEEKKEDEKGEK